MAHNIRNHIFLASHGGPSPSSSVSLFLFQQVFLQNDLLQVFPKSFFEKEIQSTRVVILETLCGVSVVILQKDNSQGQRRHDLHLSLNHNVTFVCRVDIGGYFRFQKQHLNDI